ncbi:MAG: ABC transporter ATP-binding protein [Microthrixaceae bacterium]|nr:ABC transporter ATP-binding protein [Microthrixaceae bacterium]MCO5313527.1 ABC transporter ATP-binding protein [Microthrixaceae bacterium]
MNSEPGIIDPVISLRNVVARAGRFPVLAGIDLDVNPRERVLVQGPNGAGKTSLLRVVAGLLPVSSGVATVLGHDLGAGPGSASSAGPGSEPRGGVNQRAQRRAVRASIGYLAHSTGLYDDLTAADNVRFWAQACRVPASDAEAAMDRVELAQRLRSVPVKRLSTGQRRRVSLAATIVRRPRLWLLDEPHAGLDTAGRDLVDGLIVAASEAGATVMFASHDLDRAVAVSTRIVSLSGGTVVADAA